MNNRKIASMSAAAVLVLAAGSALRAQSLDGLMTVRPGRSRAVTSSNANMNSNRDNFPRINPGKTEVLADLKGPAVIRHIWLTFNEARPNWIEAKGSAAPDETVLRMYWDDAKEPAVEAPLGDFFAAGFGRRLEVRSVPVMVEGGDGYNCYWPMPFFKRALITITNESDKDIRSFYYHIDFDEEPALPARTAYFCAQYNRAFPEKLGEDYLVLDAKGEGQYVGTAMSSRSRSPEWFGEGDVRVYIDGESKPSIQGTGTEDYFLLAWGLNEASFPYFGCNYAGMNFGDVGTAYSLYRWHIADPIRFSKSIRFTFEHTGWITGDETESGNVEGHVEREDDISTVAFWYQIGQPGRFTVLPPLAGRRFPSLDVVIEGKTLLPAARTTGGGLELQKGYDWTGDGQLFFQPAGERGVLEADFNVEKPEYRALVLRMTRAADYGIYRIFLDGKEITSNKDLAGALKPEPFDLYRAGMDVGDYYLGSQTLAAGKHTLRFECVGRNPLSSGTALGLDSVRLRERWNRKRAFLK